ncbi:acylcarnitine hydrolase-like [Arvicola amphibius]|uniref:acylcarnitine hydrolase-like n=1 Tax=Arvicola amphibius TaxID=1047088 RepID=UPI001C09C00B|nr:acylcarnitine hydrolase-like [Arvicola amphibius]
MTSCLGYFNQAVLHVFKQDFELGTVAHDFNPSAQEAKASESLFRIIPAVADGELFPRHPEKLFVSADFRPAPSIIGITNDEYSWDNPMFLYNYSDMGAQQTKEQPLSLRLQSMTPLPCPDKESEVMMLQDFLKLLKGHDITKAFPEAHASALESSIPYTASHCDNIRSLCPCLFQHPPNFFKDVRPPYMKASHGDDIFFVFGFSFWGSKFDFTDEMRLLNRRMTKYWSNFARHGNPNSMDLPHRPVFNQDELYLQLDVQPTVGLCSKGQQDAVLDQESAP